MTTVPTLDEEEAFFKMAVQRANTQAGQHIDKGAAADLAKTVAAKVTRAWKRNPARFTAEYSLFAYVARSTTNALADLARHKDSQDRAQAKFLSRTGGDRPGSNPEEKVINEETKEVVRRLIASMPLKMREIYVDFMEDVPKGETARRLGIKVSTLRTHLQRGAKLMRAGMKLYLRDGLLPPRITGGSIDE